jgi:outer membrane lipoprotein SlyB
MDRKMKWLARRFPTGALGLAFIALTSACTTTTTTTRSWGEPYNDGYWVRYGRVEHIRETIQREQGNPAGGALAGALIGGMIGGSLGGGGAGTIMGAAGGAVVGAQASQGSAERRFYEILVRFDDGGVLSVVYEGYPPFRVGEFVQQTPQGLFRR